MDENDLRAEFYHARTTDEHRDDVEYYVDRARNVDGPVLELGCGTGRVYLPALRAGIDIDGLDVSAASLVVLEAAATEEGLEPTVWQADMTSFTVDRSYELVYCPFNTMQFLRTADDQLTALDAVFDALAPGGSFVFDVFVPSFEYIGEHYGEWETQTVEFRGEQCMYRLRPRITDEPRQQLVVEYEAHDADGDLLFDGRNELTMLPYSTVELLARQSPFEEWSVTGDFTDEPLADGHTVQVWELQR